MILALGDIHLRQKRCIVERRADLAGATTDRIDYLTVRIGTCRCIAIFHRKWGQPCISRKFFSRHQNRAVDLRRTVPQILGTRHISRVESGTECSKCILNRRQCLCRAGRLCIFDCCIHRNRFRKTARERLIQCFCRRIYVHFLSRRRLADLKDSIFMRDHGVLRRCRKFRAPGLHKLGNLRFIDRCLNLQIHAGLL